MRIPKSLQEMIDQIIQKATPSSLRKAQRELTRTYREKSFSRSIFVDEAKRLVYLTSRFPATYSVIYKVLFEIQSRFPNFVCKKILDLGAGPGTATFAALNAFSNDIEEMSLIEKCPDAIALGKEIMNQYSPCGKAKWSCKDLELEKDFPSADLIIISYVLGELKHPETLIDRILNSKPSYLIVIEPGTFCGYQLIRSVREQLLKAGFHLMAPCPHSHACPLKGGDWCHFPARIERSRLHRFLKEGSLNYEDEKYSYLAVSRTPLSYPSYSRILRHPQKGSGHVRFTLCKPDGQAQERVISKKEKEIYRLARNVKWGESWSS